MATVSLVDDLVWELGAVWVGHLVSYDSGLAEPVVCHIWVVLFAALLGKAFEVHVSSDRIFLT